MRGSGSIASFIYPSRHEAPAITLTRGARLGPYEILSALGTGGMGEVYRARDTQRNRDVAIKVLPSALASAPVSLA